MGSQKYPRIQHLLSMNSEKSKNLKFLKVLPSYSIQHFSELFSSLHPLTSEAWTIQVSRDFHTKLGREKKLIIY